MEVNKFFSDLMIAKHCATIFADIRSVVGDDIRDLQIGLRVRDWVRVRVSNFKPVTFLESSLYMLVFR